MSMIKLLGKTSIQGKTIFDTGYSYKDAATAAYIAAVEAADGQELEVSVKEAVDNFIVGCKADGIWNALKASCILAGARTLNGALVPLVGTAPTNLNFVSADYNRKTGLLGNGSTKYINTNRNHNLDAQNSHHAAVWATSISSTTLRFLYGAAANNSGGSGFRTNTSTSYTLRSRSNGTANQSVSNITNPGLKAINRSSSANYTFRSDSTNYTIVANSTSLYSTSSAIFANLAGTTVSGHTASRISFYTIGSSLDLALLNTRVSDLMTALNAAI